MGDPKRAVEVQRMFDAWIAAQNARSIEGVMAVYDKSVVLSLQGDTDKNYAEIEAGFRQEFSWAAKGTWSATLEEIYADKKLTVAVSRWEFRMDTAAGAATLMTTILSVDTLEQVQGRLEDRPHDQLPRHHPGRPLRRGHRLASESVFVRQALCRHRSLPRCVGRHRHQHHALDLGDDPAALRNDRLHHRRLARARASDEDLPCDPGSLMSRATRRDGGTGCPRIGYPSPKGRNDRRHFSCREGCFLGDPAPATRKQAADNYEDG